MHNKLLPEKNVSVSVQKCLVSTSSLTRASENLHKTTDTARKVSYLSYFESNEKDFLP